MAIVSLLPHVTSVIVGDSITIIDPSGAVTGLPEPEEGVWYLVSRMVAAACPERRDLLIPGPLVRDDKGVVTGCRGLSVL